MPTDRRSHKDLPNTAVPKFSPETRQNDFPISDFGHDPASPTTGREAAKPALEHLGYLGLVPFLFGAVCAWLSPWIVSTGIALLIVNGTIVYGAVIAGYMAGMTAGADLKQDRGGITTYLPAMVATLAAWLMAVPNGFFFISIPIPWRLLGLAIVFAWLFLKDDGLARRGQWPGWYGNLRFRLSAWVIISLMAIFARMLFLL